MVWLLLLVLAAPPPASTITIRDRAGRIEKTIVIRGQQWVVRDSKGRILESSSRPQKRYSTKELRK